MPEPRQRIAGNNHRTIIEDIQTNSKKSQLLSREIVEQLEPYAHRVPQKVWLLLTELTDRLGDVVLLAQEGETLINNARSLSSAQSKNTEILNLKEELSVLTQRIEMLESRVGMDEILSDILEPNRNGR